MATKKNAESKIKEILAPKAPPPVSLEEARIRLSACVTQYNDLSKMATRFRLRMSDRTDKKTGEVRKCTLDALSRASIQRDIDRFDEQMAEHKKEAVRLLKHFPEWEWLSTVPCLGAFNVCGYALSTIDWERAHTESVLVKLFGLAVSVGEDGVNRADRPRSGQTLGYRSIAKSALYVAMQAMIKLSKRYPDTCGNNRYFKAYSDYRHRLLSSPRYDAVNNRFFRDGEWRPGGKAIIQNMAWRPAARLFISDLYVVGRTLRGMPVRPPYQFVKFGYWHGTMHKCKDGYYNLTKDQAMSYVTGGLPVWPSEESAAESTPSDLPAYARFGEPDLGHNDVSQEVDDIDAVMSEISLEGAEL